MVAGWSRRPSLLSQPTLLALFQLDRPPIAFGLRKGKIILRLYFFVKGKHYSLTVFFLAWGLLLCERDREKAQQERLERGMSTGTSGATERESRRYPSLQDVPHNVFRQMCLPSCPEEIMQEEVRQVFLSVMDSDKTSSTAHVLVGPPGTGKTTLFSLFHADADTEVHYVDIALHRTLTALREKVQFLKERQAMRRARKIIILDEVDCMTPEGQFALLSIMEELSCWTFVFLSNTNKLCSALRNRCRLWSVNLVSEDNLLARLRGLNHKFHRQLGTPRLKDNLLKFMVQCSYGDIRKAIKLFKSMDREQCEALKQEQDLVDAFFFLLVDMDVVEVCRQGNTLAQASALALLWAEMALPLSTFFHRLYEYLLHPTRLRNLVQQKHGKLHQMEEAQVSLQAFVRPSPSFLVHVLRTSTEVRRSASSPGGTHVLLTSLLVALLSRHSE